MTERGEAPCIAYGWARTGLRSLGALLLVVAGTLEGVHPAVASAFTTPATAEHSSYAPSAAGGPGASTIAAAASASTSVPHIMLIVEENEGYSNVIGSSSAPYLNSLAKSYASATNWYGVQHNSPHDYLDLTIGSDLSLPNGMPYSVTDAGR